MANGAKAFGRIALVALAFIALGFTIRAAMAGQAQSATVEIPKTPPGEQFSAWLAAFNSGDKGQLEKFRSHFDKPEDHKVEGMLGFRQQTGGFDLRKIEDSTRTQLTAMVQEHDSDQFARLKIEVEAAAPNKITHLDVRAIERPTEFALARLSQSDLVIALRAKLERDSGAGKFSEPLFLPRRKPIFTGAYGMSKNHRRPQVMRSPTVFPEVAGREDYFRGHRTNRLQIRL